jgi:sortase A
MQNKGIRLSEKVLFVVGITFLAAFFAFRIHGVLASREALRDFAAGSGQVSEGEAADAFPELENVHSNLWSEERIDAYKRSLAEPLDRAIAVLKIPKISLEVPVFNGTEDLVLNRGVGRILGTARPGEAGNIGIAGHRDGFFRGLKDIQPGDRIELASKNGKNTYVVDRTEIVMPEDVSVLGPKERPALTLVTCYPFYFVGSAPKRFIVHASIVEDAPSNPGSSSEVKSTNKKGSK